MSKVVFIFLGFFVFIYWRLSGNWVSNVLVILVDIKALKKGYKKNVFCSNFDEKLLFNVIFVNLFQLFLQVLTLSAQITVKNVTSFFQK